MRQEQQEDLMPLPLPPIRFDGSSLSRGQLHRSLRGRAVKVDDVAEKMPTVKSALRGADKNADGLIHGRREVDALFNGLDTFDRDGSYDSIALKKNGERIGLGRVMRAIGASTVEAPKAEGGAVNDKLLDWYQQPSAYRAVAGDHSTRTNMCASFVTTALEKSGALPIGRSERYVGYDDDGVPKSVRRWAPSLANYLENEKGFERVYDTKSMRPGDLVFTDGAEGTYNHVMMLSSWVDKDRGDARVTDNQGFEYVRNLHGLDGKSPSRYALRSGD